MTMSEEGGLDEVAEFLRAAASCCSTCASLACKAASCCCKRVQLGQAVDFRFPMQLML